jgi:hypothetical protein
MWASLSESISRLFFSRVWIIQEIAMSCERSLVLCGTKVTTWGRMRHVYHSLCIFDAEEKDGSLTQTLKEEILSRPAVAKAFRCVPTYLWKKLDYYHTLHDAHTKSFDGYKRQLITRCRMSQCTNPRDKVYGILSLLSQDTASMIVVSYDMEVPQLYATFSKAWIEATGDLDLLTQ